MPLCELSVRANPCKHYSAGAGVQLWTWSPVSASAFCKPVETLCERIPISQQVSSITHLIESSSDLTKVLNFSYKYSADARLAKLTGMHAHVCGTMFVIVTHTGGRRLLAAGVKHLYKHTSQSKSALVFVGTAWRSAQPTSQASQLSLSPGAAELLLKQGEDAFEREFGLYYVKHIFEGGFISALYNLEFRCEIKLALLHSH